MMSSGGQGAQQPIAWRLSIATQVTNMLPFGNGT